MARGRSPRRSNSGGDRGGKGTSVGRTAATGAGPDRRGEDGGRPAAGAGPDRRRGDAERPALPRPDAPSWPALAAASGFVFRIGSEHFGFQYRQWFDDQGAVAYNDHVVFKCRRGDEDGDVPNIFYLFKSSPNGSWVAGAGPIYFSRRANLAVDTQKRFRLMPRDDEPYLAGGHQWQKWDEVTRRWEEESYGFTTTHLSQGGVLLPPRRP